MKKLLPLITLLISFQLQAQWSGAVLDSLTHNSVRDQVGTHCMDIFQNYIHTVYERVGSGSGWELYYKLRGSNLAWGPEISVTSLAASNPAIKAKNTEEAYVVFQATDTTDNDQEIFLASNAGGNWQIQQLTHDTIDDVYPCITLDTSGFIHLAWVSQDTLGNYRIKYATNLSGTWDIQTLTNTSLGMFGGGASPDIDVEPSGVAHIVYRAEHSNVYKIDHTYNSYAGGNSWSIDNINTTNAEDMVASVKISNDTIVHITISGDGGFGFPWSTFYTKKNGSSGIYSQMQQVAAAFNGIHSNMFLDKNNVPHFIFDEVSGNILTGNPVYADSNNWAGFIVLQNMNIYNANVVIDNQLNACMLAYQGFSVNDQEVVFFGPELNTVVPEIKTVSSIFSILNNQNRLEIIFSSDFNGSVKCFSIDGKELIHKTNSFKKGDIISSSNIAAGTFIVRAQDEKNIQTIKMVRP